MIVDGSAIVMKTFAVILACAASGCLAARVETITLDLERPQQPFTLTLTEATDSTVSAQLRASGPEFDPSGWTGLLWYGTAGGGLTITNSTAGYGIMTWSVPVASMPTNGRYSVQILGAISNRVEEWGRGALNVRLNHSQNSMPAQWMTNNPAYMLAMNVSNALADAERRIATNTAAIAVLSTNTVKVADTNGWETGAHKAWLTNETDAGAMAFARTNRVMRWYDPELSSRWAELDGGTNIVIYRYEVSSTNFEVALSADFEDTYFHTRPTNNVFPFSEGNWTGDWNTEGIPIIMLAGPEAVWLATEPVTYPASLYPFDRAQGTATVSVVSYNFVTNVEWRYVLPTNAIPPELVNLDNLQGWLNNLYAMKSVVDGHISGGSHTNPIISGAITLLNTQPTNLVGRVYASNDVLMVEWINQ